MQHKFRLYFQNRYFLVKDVSEEVDRLGTLEKYNAPNLREYKGGLPVYSMGQPTRDGLTDFMDTLQSEGFQVCIIYLINNQFVENCYYYNYNLSYSWVK